MPRQCECKGCVNFREANPMTLDISSRMALDKANESKAPSNRSIRREKRNKGEHVVRKKR
jgi:hypothetical protein